MEAYHVPALLDEAVQLLDIKPGGTYADLTFGGGGHSRAILQNLGPDGRLFGLDQDSDAKANIPPDSRFSFLQGNFKFMRSYLREAGVDGLDGVLADLGVSFHHFDTAERGFSFRFDADLDMRMNRSAKLTARQVVNNYEEKELTKIFSEYGEIDKPWRTAQAITRARENAEIVTTEDLRAVLQNVTPKKDSTKYLSKLYQAIRLEVNGEIEALKMMLEQSLKILRPGGRLVIISYHSLEDRLVKNFFRYGNFSGEPVKDFYGRVETPFRIVTKNALAPSEEEIGRNPRSRSAKMRAAEKL